MVRIGETGTQNAKTVNNSKKDKTGSVKSTGSANKTGSTTKKSSASGSFSSAVSAGSTGSTGSMGSAGSTGSARSTGSVSSANSGTSEKISKACDAYKKWESSENGKKGVRSGSEWNAYIQLRSALSPAEITNLDEMITGEEEDGV